MRVAVTGATGFLGAHVATRLLERGHDPVCLVRASSRVEHLHRLGVATVEGDVHDADALRRLCEGADAVVHAAGLVKALTEAEYVRVNEGGTRAVADAALAGGAKRFVLVSSIAAKGPSNAGRARAADDAAPVSIYGRSKRAGELAALEAAGDGAGMAVRIIRPPVLYGPGDQALLPLFRAARRGLFPMAAPRGATLSLLSGPDAAACCVAMVEAKRARTIVEPDDGGGHTWAQFKDALGEAVGTRVRAVPIPAAVGHAAAYASHALARLTRRPSKFNPDKAREMRQPHWLCDRSTLDGLDWRPRWTLAEGLAETAHWYREKGTLRAAGAKKPGGS